MEQTKTHKTHQRREMHRPPGWRSRNNSGHRSPIVAAFVHQFKVKSASPSRGCCNTSMDRNTSLLHWYIWIYLWRKYQKKRYWWCTDNLLADATTCDGDIYMKRSGSRNRSSKRKSFMWCLCILTK